MCWVSKGLLSGNNRNDRSLWILICLLMWNRTVCEAMFLPVPSEHRIAESCSNQHTNIQLYRSFSLSAAAGQCLCVCVCVCVCVSLFDHCHYQLLTSGRETATLRPLSLSFHISISFFVLSSLWVILSLCILCYTVSLREQGHTLVPSSVSSRLYLSHRQDSGLHHFSTP